MTETDFVAPRRIGMRRNDVLALLGLALADETGGACTPA
jgi:hypothetical protein